MEINRDKMNAPMQQNTEDDIDYTQNHSNWLDLVIISATMWVMLRRKGAY
jgi:lipopolysaccharide/colanic/teichoic acid biosynthesis glycosyltransferase